MGVEVSYESFWLGTGFAVLGLILCIGAIVRRHFTLGPNRRFEIGGEFARCLSLSIVGAAFGAVGFWCLLGKAIRGPVSFGSAPSGLSEVLIVLALLAGGAFAGFCAVDFQKGRADEVGLLNFISCLFNALFFALLYLIFFCLGDLPVSENPITRALMPLCAGLMLATFTVLDYWDYRMPPSRNKHSDGGS